MSSLSPSPSRSLSEGGWGPPAENASCPQTTSSSLLSGESPPLTREVMPLSHGSLLISCSKPGILPAASAGARLCGCRLQALPSVLCTADPAPVRWAVSQVEGGSWCPSAPRGSGPGLWPRDVDARPSSGLARGIPRAISLPERCLYLYVFISPMCSTLCKPGDYVSPVSSVHGILQARSLAWVAISYSIYL